MIPELVGTDYTLLTYETAAEMEKAIRQWTTVPKGLSGGPWRVHTFIANGGQYVALLERPLPAPEPSVGRTAEAIA